MASGTAIQRLEPVADRPSDGRFRLVAVVEYKGTSDGEGYQAEVHQTSEPSFFRPSRVDG